MKMEIPDCLDISGFGGGYEATCKRMLCAGLDWVEKHPKAKPKFMSLRNVFGVTEAKNEDAKSLEEAILASDSDITGAQFHAIINHILFILKNGYDKWVEELWRQYDKRGVESR